MAERTYRFTLTFTVDDEHEGFDDPEWVADAAWGALTSSYRVECTYGEIELVNEVSDRRA